MKISREVRTAILVISGLLLLIYMYNFLKGENLLDSSRTYYVTYNNVGGVSPATLITINGLTVGKVQEINFTEDGSGKLKVRLSIDSDFQFSKNSIAELYDNGLIGGKAIAIVPAFDNAENAINGGNLLGTTKGGLTDLISDAVGPLQEKMESIMVSADTTLTSINSILDKDTKSNLKAAIAGLTSTINSFKKTSESLNNLIKNNEQKLNATLSNVEKITTNISSLTEDLTNANLGETVASLQSTLTNFDNMLTSIEKGEGSVGKLLNDDELYKNLNGTMKEMEELLRDIKIHPKRYFRVLSRKEIPYQKTKADN